MSTIGERIRILRESTGLGRTLFCRKHGLKEPTLVAIEGGRSKPGADIIEKIVLGYPEYCYWLITGKTNLKVDQTRPNKDVSSEVDMTVAEDISKFLKANGKMNFCDDCIADKLDINRHQTQQTTHPFGLTSDFRRTRGRCDECGVDNKLVIGVTCV